MRTQPWPPWRRNREPAADGSLHNEPGNPALPQRSIYIPVPSHSDTSQPAGDDLGSATFKIDDIEWPGEPRAPRGAPIPTASANFSGTVVWGGGHMVTVSWDDEKATVDWGTDDLAIVERDDDKATADRGNETSEIQGLDSSVDPPEPSGAPAPDVPDEFAATINWSDDHSATITWGDGSMSPLTWDDERVHHGTPQTATDRASEGILKLRSGSPRRLIVGGAIAVLILAAAGIAGASLAGSGSSGGRDQPGASPAASLSFPLSPRATSTSTTTTTTQPPTATTEPPTTTTTPKRPTTTTEPPTTTTTTTTTEPPTTTTTTTTTPPFGGLSGP